MFSFNFTHPSLKKNCCLSDHSKVFIKFDCTPTLKDIIQNSFFTIFLLPHMLIKFIALPNLLLCALHGYFSSISLQYHACIHNYMHLKRRNEISRLLLHFISIKLFKLIHSKEHKYTAK